MFNLFSSFSIIVVGLVLFISLLLKFIEHIEIITIPSLAQKLLKTTIKIASVYLVIATLIIVFWPKNDRQIRKIISNQVRVETEKAKEALTVLEKKSKNGLSLKEIIEAKNLKKQIEKTEEYYKSDDFEEKGVALKPAPAKPEEPWPWIFEWVRSEAKWEWAKKAGRKKKGEKYPARLIEITPLLLTMEYVSGYSGKPEKVVLGVGNTGDFYAANYYIKNKNPKKTDLSLKISLHNDPESPGNFVGTFWQDQDNQQVDCWLSKK